MRTENHNEINELLRRGKVQCRLCGQRFSVRQCPYCIEFTMWLDGVLATAWSIFNLRRSNWLREDV